MFHFWICRKQLHTPKDRILERKHKRKLRTIVNNRPNGLRQQIQLDRGHSPKMLLQKGALQTNTNPQSTRKLPQRHDNVRSGGRNHRRPNNDTASDRIRERCRATGQGTCYITRACIQSEYSLTLHTRTLLIFYPFHWLQYGLYSSFMASFIYVILGTCKESSIGPTAIQAILIRENIHGLGPSFAILLCFLSGIVQLIMGALQLGIV